MPLMPLIRTISVSMVALLGSAVGTPGVAAAEVAQTEEGSRVGAEHPSVPAPAVPAVSPGPDNRAAASPDRGRLIEAVMNVVGRLNTVLANLDGAASLPAREATVEAIQELNTLVELVDQQVTASRGLDRSGNQRERRCRFKRRALPSRA